MTAGTLLVTGCLLLAVGCATTRPPEASTAPSGTAPAAPPQREAAPYRLQAGDILDVKMFYAPELNENATIRPDGKIALQLIGEVDAAGLTAGELTKTVRERYTGILVNPEVAVLVRKFASLKAYVGGEVTTPGLVSYESPVTLLQALIQVGWLKPSSEPRNVVIIRNAGNNQPSVHFVDVKQLVDSPETARETMLHPFDIVYVPKSRIAKVQDFIDQYVDKVFLTPISRIGGFGFAYMLNPVTVPETGR